MNTKKWWESKTIWTGVAGIVGAVAGYLTKEATLMQAVGIAVLSLQQIFQRTGTLEVQAAIQDATLPKGGIEQ